MLQIATAVIDSLLTPLGLHQRAHDDLASILLATLRGARFAIATRLPYAFVLAFIYGKGTLRMRIQYVLKSAQTHAQHLATGSAVYRMCMVTLRRTRHLHGVSQQLESLFSGLLAGWYAFGYRDFINEQIILYSAGRLVATVFARDVASKDFPALKPRPIERSQFRALASAVTGLGLFCAVKWPQRVSPGLLQSLHAIYL